MFARREVLLRPPSAPRSGQLLPSNAPVSLLKSTLVEVLILINLKPFRINTYAKPGAGVCLPAPFSSPVSSIVHFPPSPYLLASLLRFFHPATLKAETHRGAN